VGLIVGFANDGIAGVPGVLRVTVENQDGKVLKSGCLDAGYPLPGKIRQAQFVLPNVTDWKGLKLRAEIEVKGMRYPVRWACHQKLNDDGSLTLRRQPSPLTSVSRSSVLIAHQAQFQFPDRFLRFSVRGIDLAQHRVNVRQHLRFCVQAF
jgi:hypothetical protein